MGPKQKSYRQFNSPSEELNLFHYMISRIGDEIKVIDKNGYIVFANEAAVKGTGYSKKFLLGKPITFFRKDKLNLDDWKRKYFNAVKKRKEAFTYRIERKVKGGKLQFIDVKAVFMKIKDQEYILTVCHNVTESIRLHQQVRESEELYRQLSEQAAEGILLVDLNGKIVYANRNSKKLFARPLSKIIGESYSSLIDSASHAKANRCFNEVKKGNIMICSELYIIGERGKKVPTEFSATPIYHKGRVNRMHVIIRDIKKRIQYEKLMRENEKNAAVKEFLTGTTIEIHQPLKALMLKTKGLVKEYQNKDFEYIGYKEFNQIFRSLRSVYDQAKYCHDTIDRLISLNKRKIKLQSRCSSVAEIIKDALNTVSHDLEIHDIKVVKKISANVPFVGIGVIDLSQVMINILTNAIQSMPGGGTVEIKVSVLRKEKQVKIICKDEGIGINKEILPKVFDPFFTTKRRGLEKSSGLGLSIVQSIVKSYKGEVSIQSSLREGTSITILLPFCRIGSNKS